MTESTPLPAKRPGGRAAQVSRRIEQATLDLLIEGGIERCTIPNVAERAGIQRSTLYRRYGDRWGMMIDAVARTAAEEVTAVSPGASFADNLRDVLWKLSRMMETPIGAAAISVAAMLRASPDRERATRFWATRLTQLDPMFDAAVKRGELPADVNREDLFAFAAGPVHFRLLIAQQPADRDWVERVVAAICTLYGLPSGADSTS
jgi:AcrR family transcriptional regulator